ncbi:Fur-regulated basic protein FbpA [Ornithinibacillus xuwenensis]|uniref:Fur-regulated basic protein FbpA n=1 Tax=Ornithinibacillus xuwenensis TaxID=3144668 RepID=A0ABU9XE36_9BACI
MNTLKSIDQCLRDSEVKARKNYLIGQLRKMGIEKAKDGRSLGDLSLYSLEWMYVEEINKAAKAYGETV